MIPSFRSQSCCWFVPKTRSSRNPLSRWWNFKACLSSPRTFGKMDQFDDNIFSNGWLNHQPAGGGKLVGYLPPFPQLQSFRVSVPAVRTSVWCSFKIWWELMVKRWKMVVFCNTLVFTRGFQQGVVSIQGGFHTLIFSFPGHLHRGLMV